MTRFDAILHPTWVIMLLMLQTVTSQYSSEILFESSYEPLGDSQSVYATETVSISSTASTTFVSTRLDVLPSSYDASEVAIEPTISTSMSTSSLPLRSSSVVLRPNPAGNSYLKCTAKNNICQNSGDCFVGGMQNEKICICKGNYYGPKCEKEGNPLFRPLVYAFGGTTGFLLLVICIALLMSCKKRRNETDFSKDLDSFNNVGLRAKGNLNGGYDG